MPCMHSYAWRPVAQASGYLGHSTGETAMAYADGLFTLEQVTLTLILTLTPNSNSNPKPYTVNPKP